MNPTKLIKYQWVAYGLDMTGYLIIETEGTTMVESHRKAVEQFNELLVDFDVVELFDSSFRKSLGWE
jgi:hypothetical protein